MLALLPIVAALAVDSTSLRPTAETPAGLESAAVVVHRQPALPVVSLRLSVLANDPPGYAGAGHLIQHLLFPTLQASVQRIGGQVQMQRTADAVVYTVTGPASELRYLADLLTSTLEPPLAAQEAVLIAGRDLREERLAEWETAPAHVRSLLRAQVFPADISAAGTDRSAARFTPTVLSRLWAEMYRPERVSVVAVGDVYLGDVQAALSRLPAAAGAVGLPATRDSVVLVPLAPAEATRAWVGAAYPAGDLDPAAVTVATRLLNEVIQRRLPAAGVAAEHWWTHHGQAVALVAAVPGPQLPVAREVVGTAVGILLSELSFLRVVDAAAAIRREMLFFTRTPDRMAEMIGQFTDREGDPNAAELFYGSLERLDDDDVRTVLEWLIERTPARAEIPPQRLFPRPR
jgi:hypothetical protein